MRTTIDLRDSLFQKAKLAALQRRQTLKQFFTEILESALVAEVPQSQRMSKPPIALKTSITIPALSNRETAAMFDEEDLAKFPNQ